MLLEDKVVLISGIGPGLGVKLAVEAAREGASAVIVSARTAAKLDDAESKIKALGTHCKVLKKATDIKDAAQCKALVDAGVKAFGRIDALVNSAFEHGPLDFVSSANLEGWLTGPIGTNLLGTLKLTQAVIPAMKAQGGGAIVMINTMAVRKVPPLGEAGYAASKAALAATVKYLAKEVGPHKIRVNTVHMGWMWGAPVQGYLQWQAQQQKKSLQEMLDQVAANIPLGRIPPDEECARAALFMVSDYASVVTGASLDVNGGEYMP